MKLKVKLFIAFFSVIVLPVLLISCAAGVILQYQMASIEECYDVESDTLEVIQNPLRILNRVTRGAYNEIRYQALKNPEKLEDKSYLLELNNELEDKYSFIILRTNGEVTFMGNDEKGSDIVSKLPAFGDFNANVDGGIYISGKSSFLVKQQDFFNTNRQECSVFVVTDVNTLVPQIKGFALQMSIAFLIIISFTSFAITWWIYKSIIKPLSDLRVATNRMKEGDLNFSIIGESKDEIGLLCEDFEEMRLKLKELIETKLYYEKQSKELISNISHDLKTPLTAIKGYAEGILDGVADTEEKRNKYLKTICTKANDMTVLVEELSLYSRFDRDSIPYHFMKINLEQYFSDCISELMLDMEVKNIDIGYFNYASPNLNVIVDPEQIKKVINNIISNAVKYMDKSKGIINIRIQEEQKKVQVEIEDNGRGIPEKDLPYIFDRFYRADSSRNSTLGGSGLGLAIAKKIIDDHEGEIWAKSKESMGTIICFTLKKEMRIHE